MTTQNTSNILATSLNRPTTSEGGFKKAVWTTNGQLLVENGTISATLNAETVTFTHSVNGQTTDYPVPVGTLAARSLFESFRGDIGLDDLLKTMAGGYLTLAQAKTVVDNKPKSLSPIADTKRVLTATEYRNNCIKLADPDLLGWYSKASTVSEKTAKTDLLSIIADLTSQLMTTNQVAEYEAIVAVEAADAAKYQGLTDLGITDITRLTTGLINCRVPMLIMSQGLDLKLNALGFSLREGMTMPAPGILAISIVEGQPVNI